MDPDVSGRCPLCTQPAHQSSRYPFNLCSGCQTLAADEHGRLVALLNEDLSGGFLARFRDDGSSAERITQTGRVLVGDVACRAEEARFGGIVIQPEGLLWLLDLEVFAADVGSATAGHLSWARVPRGTVERPAAERSTPAGLSDAIVERLRADRPVALGLESPLTIPVRDNERELTNGRAADRSRPRSAGAGPAVRATGLVETAWILRAIRTQVSDVRVFLDWEEFRRHRAGLFIWEALVSHRLAGTPAVPRPDADGDDAAAAGVAFRAALPTLSAPDEPRPLSLAGCAALWSGCTADAGVLHQPACIIYV